MSVCVCVCVRLVPFISLSLSLHGTVSATLFLLQYGMYSSILANVLSKAYAIYHTTVVSAQLDLLHCKGSYAFARLTCILSPDCICGRQYHSNSLELDSMSASHLEITRQMRWLAPNANVCCISYIT